MDQMKSIDVGGIFLMDLSVNESDISNQPDHQSPDGLRPANRTTSLDPIAATHYSNQATSGLTTRTITHHQTASSSIAEGFLPRQEHRSKYIYQHPDYLGSSLDRLASFIHCDEQQQQEISLSTSNSNIDDEQTVTMVEPRGQHRDYHCCEPQPSRSSFSFSDESFAASSDASLSASYIGGSDEEEDVCDKDSLTTREDSGVLDMKDLEGQLNSCNSYEDKNHVSSLNGCSPDLRHSEQKPVPATSTTNNIMAKNLISANKEKNFDNYHNLYRDGEMNTQHSHRSFKPTDGSDNGSTNNHHQRYSQPNHHHRHLNYHSEKRRVSASVPIQVPTRQMRKDLNKMKLNLLKEEQPLDQESPFVHQDGVSQEVMIANNKTKGKIQSNLAVFEDDDTFLEQEYNANHHNHYPIDEHDDEKLTAEDDPMKLFASIQALARSLHEDAEIFGSLPPKRTLESPIRSMALV